MYLLVFLYLYESFWKGFESDQRRLTLPVSNVCLSGASDATVYVLIKVDCLQSAFFLKIRLVLS